MCNKKHEMYIYLCTKVNKAGQQVLLRLLYRGRSISGVDSPQSAAFLPPFLDSEMSLGLDLSLGLTW